MNLKKFLKLAERYETVYERNARFAFPVSVLFINFDSVKPTQNVCSKHHNRWLRGEEKPDGFKTESKGAQAELANPVAIANSCSGSWQIVALILPV